MIGQVWAHEDYGVCLVTLVENIEGHRYVTIRRLTAKKFTVIDEPTLIKKGELLYEPPDTTDYKPDIRVLFKQCFIKGVKTGQNIDSRLTDETLYNRLWGDVKDFQLTLEELLAKL